jgi:predicted N-acetyltransferase YhbS
MKITIRQEISTDYDVVYDITEQAFGQKVESVLVNLLRQSDEFIQELSLVAVIDDEVVGHCMMTRLTIDNDTNYLVLAPVSVHPDYQGKSIGGQLIKKSIEIARTMKFDGISVLGHAKYYPKFGFVKASEYNITCPYEVPDESFMFLAFSDHIKEGEVVYSSAFSEV